MNKYVISFFPAVLLFGCSSPSEETIEAVSYACEKFINENMEPEYKTATKVLDVWTKNGKIVAQVGYKDYGDSAYRIRLCIYDEEEGTIMSPSPFNTDKWEK